MLVMPRGLHRYYGADHLHFITCSCYRRLPLLRSARSRDRFLSVRTNSPALPLRGGGICRNAGTYPLATERARGRDPFHGDASIEAAHGSCLVAENETARSASDKTVRRDSCAAAVLADSFP